MKHKLKDYPIKVQDFIVWFKRNYWSLDGLNGKDSSLLDWDYLNKKFVNFTASVMYDAWCAGIRNSKKNLKKF